MKSITTKYIGPSKSHGSRILAADGDNRATHAIDNAFSIDQNHVNAAMVLARRLGWTGTLAQGHTKTGCVFVFVEKGNVFDIEVHGFTTPNTKYVVTLQGDAMSTHKNESAAIDAARKLGSARVNKITGDPGFQKQTQIYPTLGNTCSYTA